jgi:hypothetical protein
MRAFSGRNRGFIGGFTVFKIDIFGLKVGVILMGV